MKEYFFKILVAGPGGAGKTSLLCQYIKDHFDERQLMTIGVDFFLKEVQLNSDTNVSLQLWDFGGQKRFRNFAGSYVEGARGALLLIDLTRAFDLERVKKWVDIVRLKRKDLPIVLVGNKADLKENISVKEEHMDEAMELFNIVKRINTSAKTGKNVDKAFETIAKVVLEDNQ